MASPQPNGSRSYFRLALFAIVLMVLIGVVIIFLDRNEVRQLANKAEWGYLSLALLCVAVSYLLESASLVLILRVYGIQHSKYSLLRLGFVSAVLSNLIALPAALTLRLLVLGRLGVPQNQTVGSTVLLSYFKNLVFYGLIPLSLIYVIFTYPLFLGGVAIVALIIAVLIVAIVIAAVIMFNPNLRRFVLQTLARVWHFVTRRNVETPLTSFGAAITQGINEIKRRPRYGIALAAVVIGDVAAMITSLFFCFKSLGIAVHVGALITGFNFGITLTVISFIPGDIGVQEVSIAGILVAFGVPFSRGVLAATLFRALYYFVPFIVSLGLYWSVLKEIHQKPE